MWLRGFSYITMAIIIAASPIQNDELEQSASPLSYAVDEVNIPGQPQGVQAARVMAETTGYPGDFEQDKAPSQLPPIRLWEKPTPSLDPTNILSNNEESSIQQPKPATQTNQSPEPLTQMLEPSNILLEQPNKSTALHSQIPKPSSQFSIIETNPVARRIILSAESSHASQEAGRPRQKRQAELPNEMTDKYVLKRILTWKHAYDTMKNGKIQQVKVQPLPAPPSEKMDSSYILRQVDYLIELAKEEDGKTKNSPYEEYLRITNGVAKNDDSQMKSLNPDANLENQRQNSIVQEAQERVNKLQEALTQSKLALYKARLEKQTDNNDVTAGAVEAPIDAQDQKIADLSPELLQSQTPQLEAVSKSPPLDLKDISGMEKTNLEPATAQEIVQTGNTSEPNLLKPGLKNSPKEEGTNDAGGTAPEVAPSAANPGDRAKDNVFLISVENTSRQQTEDLIPSSQTQASINTVEDEYDEEDYRNSLEDYQRLGNDYMANHNSERMGSGMTHKTNVPPVINHGNTNADHVAIAQEVVGLQGSDIDKDDKIDPEKEILDAINEEIYEDTFKGQDYAAGSEDVHHTNIKDKLDDMSYQYKDFLDNIYDFGQGIRQSQGKEELESRKNIRLYKKRNNRRRSQSFTPRDRKTESKKTMPLNTLNEFKAEVLPDRVDYGRSFIHETRETGMKKQDGDVTVSNVTNLTKHITKQMKNLRSTLKLLNKHIDSKTKE